MNKIYQSFWKVSCFSFASFVVLFCLLLMDTPAAQVGKAQQHATEAVTVDTKAFLKVPANVNGDFILAKTPPKVDVVFFDGLDKKTKGTLWSTWGDGCLASNGKYYTSIGDHLGIDGKCYVYEYDPETRILRRVVDVLQAIMHMLGLYGHGKIHSGIHEGADGKLYFTTYWGKHRQIEEAFKKGGYDGSILLRFDPKTGKTENLGAIVPQQGLPASTFDPKHQNLFFHAVYEGDICVYNVEKQKRLFLGGRDITEGTRTFLRGNDGRVYFSTKNGTLGFYDPATNSLQHTKAKLPESPGKKKGDSLRAATNPAKDGTLYGMTASGRMFRFQPKSETVKDLGYNFLEGDYTAVMALSPDEKYLYYAPGAHGSGNRTGCPVIQYDIFTGKRKVLAFLKTPLLERFQYKLGGTYNLQLDAKGERLFITFNGGELSARNAFGHPSVVVVHIPESER